MEPAELLDENADVNDRVELNDNGGVKVHGAVNDDVDVKVDVVM